MDYVYTRKNDDRKEIKLNGLFQPVDADTNVISELSNFLGTIARQYVPLDYINRHKVPDKNNIWEYVKQKYIIPEEGKHWVLKTIGDAWRLQKSRIKRKHYTCYNNDAERLKNRPRDIPLAEFKILIKYWGYRDVQLQAEQNIAARSCIKDTHTAGPRSFAQISNVMKLENPNQESPTKAKVFVETRKRKEGREYKSSDDVLKFRIERIKDIQASGQNVEVVEPLLEPLISGDKSHKSSWLIGRHVSAKKVRKTMKQTEPNIVEDNIEDLTKKIRNQLAEEMEEKVNQKVEEKVNQKVEEKVNQKVEEKVNQKVQENMTWMFNKLGEVNPNLKVNLEQIFTGRSSSSCNNANESSKGS